MFLGTSRPGLIIITMLNRKWPLNRSKIGKLITICKTSRSILSWDQVLSFSVSKSETSENGRTNCMYYVYMLQNSQPTQRTLTNVQKETENVFGFSTSFNGSISFIHLPAQARYDVCYEVSSRVKLPETEEDKHDCLSAISGRCKHALLERF